MSDTPQALSGSLNLSGNTARYIVAAKSLDGALALTGSVTLVVTKIPRPRPVVGMLNMSGTLTLTRSKVPSGTLRLSGTLTRSITKALSGSLSMYGDLLAGESNKLNVIGNLALSGSIVKEVGKLISGNLSLTSTLTKQVTKSLSGDLGLTGDLLIKTPKMAPSGDLTLTGTLDTAIGKALSGDLTLTGTIAYAREKNLDGWLYLGREVSLDLSSSLDAGMAYGRAPEGTLTLTGDIEGPDRTGGRLRMTGTLGTATNHVKSLSGTISITGSAGRPTNYPVSVEGGLTFMRVLTTYATPYTYENVSLLNTAASKDIEIEQGVAFRRFFRWMKSDGIPFSLSGITLEMVITTSKGDPTIIAYSPKDITITTTGFDTGVFRVDITAAKSATFDFTRANYMIVAYWASTRVRLIEGEVQLSRTLFKRLSQAVVGDAAVSGAAVKNVTKSVSGTVGLTAGQTHNVGLPISGSLGLTGTDALSAISASIGVSGSVALTGAVGTVTHEA